MHNEILSAVRGVETPVPLRSHTPGKGQPCKSFLKQACYANSLLHTCPLPHQISLSFCGVLGTIPLLVLWPLKQMPHCRDFLSLVSRFSLALERQSSQPVTVWLLPWESVLYPVATERHDRGPFWDSLRPQDTHPICRTVCCCSHQALPAQLCFLSKGTEF